MLHSSVHFTVLYCIAWKELVLHWDEMNDGISDRTQNEMRVEIKNRTNDKFSVEIIDRMRGW